MSSVASSGIGSLHRMSNRALSASGSTNLCCIRRVHVMRITINRVYTLNIALTGQCHGTRGVNSPFLDIYGYTSSTTKSVRLQRTCVWRRCRPECERRVRAMRITINRLHSRVYKAYLCMASMSSSVRKEGEIPP